MILNATPRRGLLMLLKRDGTPFSSSGFDSNYKRQRGKLLDQGLIGSGLTFKGLRHTAATNIANEGGDDGIWLVSFMHHDLGYIDLEQKTLQTIDNPFGTRVSPMS